MSDLKEFWDKDLELRNEIGKNCSFSIREKIGLFFWERGGKQFVRNYIYFASNSKAKELDVFEYAKLVIKEKTALRKTILFAQDFLDCVACLGEDKVKELIKELEGGKK